MQKIRVFINGFGCIGRSAYVIKSTAVSMIHSYTSEQNFLDSKGASSDLRRSRSATQNILSLGSTATATLGVLFPHLKG